MTASKRERASYIVPVRATNTDRICELAEYLRTLAGVQIIVVDASSPEIFRAHDLAFPPKVLHIAPDEAIGGINENVRGVVTALGHCRHECIVVASDEVRYTPWTLRAAIVALDRADVVRPQNYVHAAPAHAILDASRSLLDRAAGGDWPATIAFRKSFVPRGYDPGVLFEHLELVRTVRARGGREAVRYDLFVRQLAPQRTDYLERRVRAAYDEFARPARLIASLSIVPFVLYALAAGHLRWVATLVALSQTMAFVGWLRGGAHRYFPLLGVLAAPLAVLERAVCAWLALYERVRFGGVRYAGRIARRAASSQKELTRKWAV